MPGPSPGSDPKRITDTTLRDGAQDPRFALFPHEAKLEYFDLLHRLDNGTGVIESVEVFIYQKRDVWVLEKLLERGYEHPRVTTWTRARPKDVKLLAEVGQGRIDETGMLASASDHHIFDKLRFPSKTRALEAYLEPVLQAMELGIRPRVHLEDATRADIDGWVVPFMCRVLEETDGKALFRVCDTIGWGQPDPHADAPFGVPRLISDLRKRTGAELEFHGHNDFGLGDREQHRGVDVRREARERHLRWPGGTDGEHLAGANGRGVHAAVRRPRVRAVRPWRRSPS